MRVPDIELNPNATPHVHPIDGDRVCVVVDDFLKDPHALVDYAVENAGLFHVPQKSYPGHVLSIEPATTGHLRRFIRSTMSRHLPFMRSGIELTTLLSMTTLQPHELSNLQRLCHTDPRTHPGMDNYAALIYLFEDEDLGGTAFFRWRDRPAIVEATTLEQNNPDAALQFLKSRFALYREPPQYLTESNDVAELLAVVPARFNRWVFYSGDIPHSAYIGSPERLSADYTKGRLTLNCFASVRPR